jgi:transposase
VTTPRPNRGRARRVQAAQLWQSGLSYAQVAAQLGVAPGTIAAWLHQLRAEGADLPRSRAKLWASSEDEQLLAMLRANHSPAEIAVALGRTAAAVSSRLRKLRAAHHPKAPGLSIGARVSWTPAKDAVLIEQYRSKATHAEIAERLGCSPDSVFLRLRALDGAGADVPLRAPRWSAEDQARLARRYRQGATYKQLGAEFARTHGTISRQLKRLRDAGVDLTRTPESAHTA